MPGNDRICDLFSDALLELHLVSRHLQYCYCSMVTMVINISPLDKGSCWLDAHGQESRITTASPLSLSNRAILRLSHRPTRRAALTAGRFNMSLDPRVHPAKLRKSSPELISLCAHNFTQESYMTDSARRKRKQVATSTSRKPGNSTPRTRHTSQATP